jgi:hypothetical protein
MLIRRSAISRADFFVKGYSDREISADDLLSLLVYMWTQTPPRYEAIFLILPVLLCFSDLRKVVEQLLDFMGTPSSTWLPR